MKHSALRDLIQLAQELIASSAGLTMAQMMSSPERPRRTVERMIQGLLELGLETETGQAVGEHHLLKRARLTQPLPAPLVAPEEGERLDAPLEGVALTIPESPARRAIVKLLASQQSSVATGVAVDAHTLIYRTAYTVLLGPRYGGSESLIGQCERAIQRIEQLTVRYRKDGEAMASLVRVKPLGLLFGRFAIGWRWQTARMFARIA